MVLEILLVISVILQLVAAVVAVRLIRSTKYNSSWMLFTIALCCMAFLRLGEYVEIAGIEALRLPRIIVVWLGVITSLLFAVALLLVQKILKYIYFSEQQRRLSEKRILNMVIRTEEAERQRLSRELHDGLGPLLSSARMSISALRLDNLDEHSREIISITNTVIDEAVRSLKEVAGNLSPHILNNFGLARAINSFVNKLLKVDVDINVVTNLKEERFDSDIEVIVYRVLCELLNNSLNHSGATEIVIDMQYSGSHLVINYRDNGRGFDPLVATNGMGISNVSSRIASLKGDFRIKSEVGAGMEAQIDIEIGSR